MSDGARMSVVIVAALASGLACHRGGAALDSGAVEDPVEASGGEGSPAPLGYPGELISTADMAADFLARQKLKGSFAEHEFAFEAVLQLRGGTLTVLGLTPFGTKAFVLTQTGLEIEFQALIDREIPFPPEYMLQDIHRALMWHTRLPWGEEAPSEDTASVEVAGERVSEQWSDGALIRRTFTRLDGEPAGEIRVDYVGGHRSGQPARTIVLDNGWFGYRIEIETLDWRAL